MPMQKISYSPGMVNATLAYRYAPPESGYGQLVSYPVVRQEFHRPRASWESIQNFNTGWGDIWEAGIAFRAIGTGQSARVPVRTSEVSSAPFGAVVESGSGYDSEDPTWCCSYWDQFWDDCTAQTCLDQMGGVPLQKEDVQQSITDPSELYTPGPDDDSLQTTPEDDPVKRARAARKRRKNLKPITPKKPLIGPPSSNILPPSPTLNAKPQIGMANPGTGRNWLVLGLVAAGGLYLWSQRK
jgi:hypothetical protein